MGFFKNRKIIAKNKKIDKKNLLEIAKEISLKYDNILQVKKSFEESFETLVSKEIFNSEYKKVNEKISIIENNKYTELFDRMLVFINQKLQEVDDRIVELNKGIINDCTRKINDIELVLQKNEQTLSLFENSINSLKNSLITNESKYNELMLLIEEDKVLINSLNSEIEKFKTKKLQNEKIDNKKEDLHTRKLSKTEKFHKSYDVLKSCVLAGVVPMIVGPSGSGKSHAIEQLSADLGLDFYMANRIQNTFELTGFVNAAGEYVTTQFYEAFTKGGLFFFDEVDASSPEALVTINAAIAQGFMAFPGHPSSILMHKDFKVVVAGNTCGTGATLQYTGRNKLDAATLDRFMMINWDYDPELEKDLIKDKDLLDVCWKIREAAKKYPDIIISTRGIITLERIMEQEEKEPTKLDLAEYFKKKFFFSSKQEKVSNIIKSVQENLSKTHPYYYILGNMLGNLL